MSNEWDQLEIWGARIGAVTALAGTLYAIYKTARAGISKIINISNRLQDISNQLSPNGGSSLRDAINRIEHRQIQTEQRERAFLHMHSDAMFELNRHLALTWANKTFLDMLNIDSQNAYGYGWHTLIEESDRNRVIDQFTSASETSRNVHTIAKLIIDHNLNNVDTFIISGTVMLDSTNKTGGYLISVKHFKSEKQ